MIYIVNQGRQRFSIKNVLIAIPRSVTRGRVRKGSRVSRTINGRNEKRTTLKKSYPYNVAAKIFLFLVKAERRKDGREKALSFIREQATITVTLRFCQKCFLGFKGTEPFQPPDHSPPNHEHLLRYFTSKMDQHFQRDEVPTNSEKSKDILFFPNQFSPC